MLERRVELTVERRLEPPALERQSAATPLGEQPPAADAPNFVRLIRHARDGASAGVVDGRQILVERSIVCRIFVVRRDTRSDSAYDE